MTLAHTHSEKILVRLFLIFIVPVVFLWIGIIEHQFRLFLLLLVTLFVWWTIVSHHWSYISLWFRTDNLRRSLIPYSLFTVSGIFILLLLAFLFGKQPQQFWYRDLHLLFLFLPISIAQEFLYRSFLMKELSSLHLSFFSLILTNTFLFTFLHIIYWSLGVILPMTFVAGVGFAWMFKKYPNFYLISLSHAVLNFTAVLFTFF